MTQSLHTYNGKPVEESLEQPSALKTVPAITTTAAAPKQTHKPEAGNVGNTGEHGELGSNAA
jgi:hypothetical protein